MELVLETERLIARAWTTGAGDITAANSIYSQPDVARWLAASTATGEIRIRVEHWSQPTTDPTYGVWAVELRADPTTPIGSVLLRPLPPADEDVEVGWHLHPARWGNGYATEIGRAAVRRAFDTGIEEVFAVVRPGNERSLAVARRLGMDYVGSTEKYYGIHAQLYRLRPGDLASTQQLRRLAGLL